MTLISMFNEFCQACAAGDTVKVFQLLSLHAVASMLAQAMSRADSPLYLAVVNNRSIVCEILLQSRDECSVICEGINNFHPITHKTALQTACELGFYDVVFWLVKTGARLNCKEQIDRHPFVLAAVNGHANICQLLLEEKSNVDDSNNEDDSRTYMN